MSKQVETKINPTPYYKRTLDSFADEIITNARQSKESGLWYAVMENGETYWNDPDFSTCAKTREAAVRLCALKIRNDHRGIGKYAPHYCLNGSVEMRLLKVWSEKEAK